MRRCDTCGNHSVVQGEVEGYLTTVCQTCGEVASDDDVLHGRIESVRRVRDWNLEPGIQPLVDALNRLDGVRTWSSCAGHEAAGTPPFVSFYIEGKELKHLERIALAVEMASRKTGLRWGLEVGAEGRISYTLRPRRSWSMTHRLTRADVLRARLDVAVLAAELERAAGANWFQIR